MSPVPETAGSPVQAEKGLLGQPGQAAGVRGFPEPDVDARRAAAGWPVETRKRAALSGPLHCGHVPSLGVREKTRALRERRTGHTGQPRCPGCRRGRPSQPAAPLQAGLGNWLGNRGCERGEEARGRHRICQSCPPFVLWPPSPELGGDVRQRQTMDRPSEERGPERRLPPASEQDAPSPPECPLWPRTDQGAAGSQGSAGVGRGGSIDSGHCLSRFSQLWAWPSSGMGVAFTSCGRGFHLAVGVALPRPGSNGASRTKSRSFACQRA